MFSQDSNFITTSWRVDAHERDWFPSVTAAVRQSMSALTNTVVAAMDINSAMSPGTLCQNFNFTSQERQYLDEPDLRFIDHEEEVVTQQFASSTVNTATAIFFKVTPSRGKGMLKCILPTTDLHNLRVGVLEHP